MRPAFLLALAMWALLGWLALPGASATICPSSPYTMDSTKTSADLNGVLASWSNVSCTGSIIFTATAKTYYLADPTYIASGADFTLDASLGNDIEIVAPLNKRIMLVNDPNGPAAVTSPTFLTLKNLVFRGNGEVPDSYPIWYENDGGGFILDGLDFTATDCVFTDFTVEAGCCGDGGVIVAYNSRFTLERCEFSNTYGAVAGGALETADASGTITDCIFRNNTALDYNAGAILLISTNATISGTLFEGNSAHTGGALTMWKGTTTIMGCTFKDNMARVGVAGAIEIDPDAVASIFDTVFVGNSAPGLGQDVHATAPFICVNSCPADTEPPNQCACTAARLYETVAVAEYCDPATTVSMAQVTSPVQSCYDACKTFYSPALNSLDTFLFQLVNVNGQRECQCAETCQTVLTQPGAVLMGTCFPSTALQLKPTVSRRYLPANHAKRPVTLTYTLRVRGSAKNVQLSGMGVQVTLPPGSVVKAAKPKPATTQDGTVTWYPVAFRGKRTSTFRVKVTVSPPFAAGGLVFRSGVVQIADNLPTYPYCLLPASDMAVVAKTS